MFPEHFFNVASVGGATVSGLKNPNSKTQALPIFMAQHRSSKTSTTILLLGEVDAGFVIWYRAEKYKVTVETMLKRAIENYSILLKEVALKSRIICISAPLPTIQDGQYSGEIANARKSIKATQAQRTELTLRFNQKMQSFCKEYGYTYLPFDDESQGQDGLVNRNLVSPNPVNHHYDMGKYADMIISKLKECDGLTSQRTRTVKLAEEKKRTEPPKT